MHCTDAYFWLNQNAKIIFMTPITQFESKTSSLSETVREMQLKLDAGKMQRGKTANGIESLSFDNSTKYVMPAGKPGSRLCTTETFPRELRAMATEPNQ
ncbi:hypothetical protein PENANT_c031G05680 [Penicillium antarcticum]|uniref:Uncharacterized protein n=1 Tax=Penicillium antarcticum TaxID=416450 RepID=A0A1V6PVW6_9EURO|nr:hypothetical protein PENANT_c031G05680 [Penicillium antarcticum]